MKFKRVWGFAGAVLYVQVATGCGSVATPDGTPGSGEAASGPSAGAAKAVRAPDKSSAPVLFKDSHVSGLRLDVYEIGGYPVVAVSGHIGTPLPALPANATLAEIYVTLHPDEAAAPSALAPLDARLVPLRAAIAPAVPVASQTATVEKNLGASGFYWYFCTTIPQDGWSQWVPLECDYFSDASPNWGQLGGPSLWLGKAVGYDPWQYFPLQRGDKTLAVNLTNNLSSFYFTMPDGNSAGGGYIWVDSLDWSWIENYGPGPYGANYYIEVAPEYPIPAGEMGLTLHRLSPIVK